jgi:hypothetical protein
MNKRLLLLLLASIFVTNLYSAPVSPARNKDGSLVTGILEAAFDPVAEVKVLPFPTNLFFPQSPPIDLTVGIPGLDESDFTQPAVALNSLDGFSTSEKWITTFTQNLGGFPAIIQPGQIDPTSVVPGQSVRVFEVTTLGYPYIVVTGVVRELVPLAEFVAASAEGGVLAIIPTSPLKEQTTYMAVVTNDVNDVNGNDATPSSIYHLAKRRTPWVDENGNSTYPLLPDATAQALEPLRQLTMFMELSAASAGVNPDDIIVSWTVHTQSITPTLTSLRAIAEPAPTIIVPTPLTSPFGLANIHIGVISLPYYSGIPGAANPAAPLTDFWKSEPGGYIFPYNQIPFLDPTSTKITRANPLPVMTGVQTVPLLITVPNENSGFSKPEEGWPVVIYLHGLSRNRTDMLAMADTVAQTGRVFVAMDQPLHGVVPDLIEPPELAGFYIENTPFAGIANERTFDADYWNNETGAPGGDGKVDPSGRSSFNLANLQATRDNVRQGEADWSILTLSLQNMSIDGDETPDLNAFDVSLISHSAGGYLAVPYAAVEPIVSRMYANATGGGMMRSLNGGHLGPDFVQPSLSAAGIEVGTPEFEQYLLVAQTLLDSGDSINWATDVAGKIPFIHNEVLEDGTVPNVVPGAPLAGSEALNRIMGLASYGTTQANPDGLLGVARFLQPADHSSLLEPVYPAVTAEMQGQMASFIASGGTFVQVGNPDLLLPVIVAEPGEAKEAPEAEKVTKGKSKGNKAKGVSRIEPAKRKRD